MIVNLAIRMIVFILVSTDSGKSAPTMMAVITKTNPLKIAPIRAKLNRFQFSAVR
jgi:hypothetical protein